MALEVVVDGLAFGEGPRWHDGRLWYSDMHSQVVQAVDLDGRVETIVEVPLDPSGLGWLPDGRLLVVSMNDRRVLRLEPDGSLVTHADLSHLASFTCNDMVVDRQGRAYVGNFGFDLHAGAAFAPAELILVEPDGSARVVARDLSFPNGMVITPDESTLILAESAGRDLLAFDLADDGGLSGRRTWADLGDGVPDGICLDAEGAVWFADPYRNGCFRVGEGGEVLGSVDCGRPTFACMLGGPERRHLFALTAQGSAPDAAKAARSGRVEVIEVDVPGAGWP
jgi:sugar lactone lactonase YvrE